MTEEITIDDGGKQVRRGRGRGLLVTATVAAIVIVIGIGGFTASRGPRVATSPLDLAKAFWVAVSDGDRETAIGLLDPEQVENGVLNLFGRAHTIEGQLDWYEAVGFRWALDQCVQTAEGVTECTVSGRNAWSEAIGLEPVPGTFAMEIGESAIRDIREQRESFRSQWLPQVHDVFNRWVETHYPADAPIMWNDSDITPEGLELFEINTARFVEAYPTE